MTLPMRSRQGHSEPAAPPCRILAVSLLIFLLVWLLLGKGFLSERPCGWTVGQGQPAGQAEGFLGWFEGR